MDQIIKSDDNDDIKIEAERENDSKRKTILIADDIEINRLILRNIFEDEYRISEAENGVVALNILRNTENVVAVLLDLQMPELDGYGVMAEMQKDERLKAIPVVIITASTDEESQVRALSAGAYDVLFKPVNPTIALHRVKSIIARAEAIFVREQNLLLTKQLRESEIDEKTGIYTFNAFCEKAKKMLLANPDKEYLILRFDIDNFKMYNDIFGMEAGDILLREIGNLCKATSLPGMLYAHYGADHFLLCLESELMKRFPQGELLKKLASEQHRDFDIVGRVGVYVVEDKSIPISLMCDRALLALRTTKGDYSQRIGYYNDDMRLALLDEQTITGEMIPALEGKQFLVYLQPQYNQDTMTLYGAEALVRWKHPTKGMISPGKFIPLFERNGFISTLDMYILDQVCRLQRGWIDSGLSVVPVSVNLSRRDIYNPGLCEDVTTILEKYDLSPELIHLEITESAYMENPRLMIDTVKTLRSKGFHVEIDDFGSGFSSLNTLKELPVDTLKLDMKFMADTVDNRRGGSILSSIVRMAHLMKLPVIAEGVEKKEQADFLKSIGCYYIQGYYFDRPMPVIEFEERLRSFKPDTMRGRRFTEDVEGATDFLSPSSQATLLFNSFVGGAGILEYNGENVEGLRFNDNFFISLGISRGEYDDKQLNLRQRFDDSNWQILLEAINKAIETRRESVCEIQSKPLGKRVEPIWTRVRLRFLAQSGTRKILYMAVDNIDSQMQLMLRVEKLSKQLEDIMKSVPGGILNYEYSDTLRLTYANEAIAEMFGYRYKEYIKLFSEAPFDTVYAEDQSETRSALRNAVYSRKNFVDMKFRHVCKDGSYHWVRLCVRINYRQDRTCNGTCILMIIDEDVIRQERVDALAKQLKQNNETPQLL